MSRGALIRRSVEGDREPLYEVCLATGRDGEDASGDLRDPRLLGLRYVGPYLTLEPDLAFTLEDDAGPCGYVLGTADTRGFARRYAERWRPVAVAELAATRWREDDAPPHERSLRHEILHPTFVVPADEEAYPAHLHIDLLPRARGLGHGRRLIDVLLVALSDRHCAGVHLNVSSRNRRAIGFYQHLSFRELPAREPAPHTVVMGRRLA